MSEPNTITSGDAIAWRRSLTASVDSAEYRLVGAGNFSIAAAIDGNDVVVNVNSATSTRIIDNKEVLGVSIPE